jgi:hypothetical protein
LYILIVQQVHLLQGIPNRTPADDAAISQLLEILRGGVENERQHGDLMTFLACAAAAYGRVQGIRGRSIYIQVHHMLLIRIFQSEVTRLSNQSHEVDLQKLGIYNLVLGFVRQIWPEERVYGYGVPVPGGSYLPPKSTTRNFSYLEHNGMRFGSYLHTGGRRTCYGYIDGRQPVRIDQVLLIEVPNRPHMRTICALVRLFWAPEVEPDFPWSHW